ncbi:MAG: hypothetical protein BWY65_01881 [Firmicutes bacterium ADurb.Bin373]|nr:MAG: hypothetical protein BWY65_01881 [Firmicutes bacterium ADurb.Bin373]
MAVSGKIAGAIIPGKQKKKLYLPKPEEGVVSKTSIEQTGKNMIAPKGVTDQGSKGITGRKWEPAAGEMAGGGPDQGSAAGSGAQLAPVAATRGGDLPAPGGMLSVGNPEKQTGFIADRQEIPVMDQQKTSGTGESENVGLGQISGATDINMEKTRYIAGKISGRDILDSNGQVIVARGETITAEIIDRAEKSGKLPDLIVHMVAPGLNPDWE